MREEIAFENGRISTFQELVTLNLTLDRVILHTVMHDSSTPSKKLFVDGCMGGRTDMWDPLY